jgi:hypothetical protein
MRQPLIGEIDRLMDGPFKGNLLLNTYPSGSDFEIVRGMVDPKLILLLLAVLGALELYLRSEIPKIKRNEEDNGRLLAAAIIPRYEHTREPPTDSLRILLEMGVPPDARYRGQTPFKRVLQLYGRLSRFSEAAQLLLEYGAPQEGVSDEFSTKQTRATIFREAGSRRRRRVLEYGATQEDASDEFSIEQTRPSRATLVREARMHSRLRVLMGAIGRDHEELLKGWLKP